ncbi:MAG: SIS domain-containing protein, partial [Paracoccaceae bacterium]
MSKAPGRHMQHEIAQAAGVFGATVLREIPKHQALTAFGDLRAIYTVARGSSDAVANILAYEFMASLSVPVTSLPPSVFSLGNGVDLSGAGLLIISQSGASDDLVAGARIARARGATVISVTNQPGSPVEMNSHLNIPILAGPEKAVPATKTVIGSIAAGMALLSALRPDYRRA